MYVHAHRVDESLCNVEGSSGGVDTSLDRRPVLDGEQVKMHV